MGTTTTLALVLDGEAFIAQVGDSRAYLVRKGAAKQLTKDQSFVQRLIDAGRMTAKEAAQSEHRNIILQALGPEEKVVTDFYRVRLDNDDILVLCSDGLSNQVSPEEIGRIARRRGLSPRRQGRLSGFGRHRLAGVRRRADRQIARPGRDEVQKQERRNGHGDRDKKECRPS
jgi:serine/threonine protein phosphatase PrpC